MKSTRRPARDIRRGSRRLPQLLRGLLDPAELAQMPLRAAFVGTPASLFLTKIGVAGIAGIGDSGVGGSDRLCVAGLHSRHELYSRGLHCRDQSIDTVA